ncbi:hypothetical protein pdam_00021469 [Pocillopora damicornis]|uniref:Uncharacterized protein n=1 Tax=Pocillopora damicornis TaxID=46731 RepID=A0A3M6TH11_POCDA|nr:hypothetical protein pdam_00021469 [Pocillopora damicornis]
MKKGLLTENRRHWVYRIFWPDRKNLSRQKDQPKRSWCSPFYRHGNNILAKRENFIIPQTSEVAVSARVRKSSTTSTRQIEPPAVEIASSLPSRDHANDKTFSDLVVRVISEPSSRLHKTMHLASPVQSDNISLLSPEIEHMVKRQSLSGKSGFSSPSRRCEVTKAEWYRWNIRSLNSPTVVKHQNKQLGMNIENGPEQPLDAFPRVNISCVVFLDISSPRGLTLQKRGQNLLYSIHFAGSSREVLSNLQCASLIKIAECQGNTESLNPTFQASLASEHK